MLRGKILGIYVSTQDSFSLAEISKLTNTKKSLVKAEIEGLVRDNKIHQDQEKKSKYKLINK